MTKRFYSEYYEKEFVIKEEDLKMIFELYEQWCKENKQIPECSIQNELTNEQFDHVLYHAEIQDDKNGDLELSSIIDIY